MKKYAYISLLIAAVLLASCSSRRNKGDEPTPPPEEEKQPMLFSSSISDTQSRSILEDSHTSFRVWSYKNTASGQETVMPGYCVMFLGEPDRWQYDGVSYPSVTELVYPATQYLKYWDGSAQNYQFFGYAPANLPEDITVTTTPAGEMFVTGLTANKAIVVDFLVTNHIRHVNDQDLRDTDLYDPNNGNITQPRVYYSVMPLRFHRPYSQIKFRIYNAGNTDATVTEAYITTVGDSRIFASGDLSVTGWSNHSQPQSSIVSQDLSYSPLELPAEMERDDAVTLSSLYEIPQTLPGEIRVTLTVNSVTINKVFDFSGAWEVGGKYIYYILIDAQDGIDPILVDLNIPDFGEGGEHELEETNW